MRLMKSHSPLVLGVLIALICAPYSPLVAQDAIPDTAAGKRLGQMIDSVKSGGDAMENFITSGFKDQGEDALAKRRSNSSQISSMLGSIEFEKLVESSEHSISARCTSENGPKVIVSISVDEEEPYQITSIRVEPAGEDGESDTSPLNMDEKKEVIQSMIDELRSKYVFPKVAEEMAIDLENSLEAGDYNEIDRPQKFAETLTTQLREICKDKHLRVRSGGVRRPGSSPGRRASDNHGFVKVETLPGGVGYLKFNYFSGDGEAEKTAAAAMNFLGNSEAIIFDLRENGGGSPDMIAFLQGYLFEESVHLNSFYNRPTDTTSESWSRDDVPGKKMPNVDVYVLTSSYTFSGAEEFSYNLKNLKRGTIVGETTGGGAHPVMGVGLGKRFSMSMPFARAINPITNTNWEGVGVKPDVAVSANEALDKAIELAKMKISERNDKAVADATDSDPGEISQKARAAFNGQDFAAAAPLFRELVKLQPENGDAWFRLGYSLHMSGKIDEAIEVHKKAAEFDGTGVIAAYNLACAYSLKDKKDDAIEALKKAIAKGFRDGNQIKGDSDMDNIRDDDRFKAILKELEGGRRPGGN